MEELAAKRYVSPYYRAIALCTLGEHEQAFTLLEQSFADREAWIVWLSVQPQFDPLRADPRFADLATKGLDAGRGAALAVDLQGHAPVAGTVSATNEQLDSAPEVVNADPLGEGWLVEITPADGVEQALKSDGLLDAAEYAALTAQA